MRHRVKPSKYIRVFRVGTKEPGGFLVNLFETSQTQSVFHSRTQQTVNPSLKRGFEMLAEIENHGGGQWVFW